MRGPLLANFDGMQGRRKLEQIATPKQILIVEDDADAAQVLSLLLEQRGYDVTTRRNGREALAYLQGGARPDLILSDLQMPQMDGYELTDQLRSDANLARVPLVVMTAIRAFDRARLGPVPVLSKPLRVHKLLTMLAHHG